MYDITTVTVARRRQQRVLADRARCESREMRRGERDRETARQRVDAAAQRAGEAISRRTWRLTVTSPTCKASRRRIATGLLRLSLASAVTSMR